MKKNYCLPLTVAVMFMLGLLTACQTESKSSAAKQVAAKPATQASQPEAAKVGAAKSGSLATPTEAYKTAFAARQKKELAGLKQSLSKRMLSFFADMAKSEQKTLDDELKEMMAAPQVPTDEVRNEKITGDKATLEYLNDKGKWAVMDFVQEGPDWKLTLPNAKPTIIQDTTRK